MSSLPGGPADKASTVYEGLWGVYAMVQVLAGHATALRIEPPRVDDAEFYLQKAEHNEYWQTKRQLLSQNTWTLQKLKTTGVLDFFSGTNVGRRCRRFCIDHRCHQFKDVV